MCTTCGCGHRGWHAHGGVHDDHAHRDHAHGDPYGHPPRQVRTVLLERELLAKNNRIAADVRRSLAELGVTMLNLIGAPGAGKTALLEATVGRLRHEVPLAVIEGDQATDLDARRIERAGCRVHQINTGAGCHLDASMVSEGLAAIAPPPGSVVFVENVGNLVCPALFDVGELAKVVVMSVTEGEDKPLKYAHVFRAADALVLTKTDLLAYVPYDEDACVSYARSINPDIKVLPVSAVHMEGIDAWCRWIERRMRR